MTAELDSVLEDFDSKLFLAADELRKEGRDEESRHWAFKLRKKEEEFEQQRVRDKEAYEALKTQHETELSEIALEQAELRGQLISGLEKD